MRAVQVAKRNWRNELNKYLIAYRSTTHTTTGKSLHTCRTAIWKDLGTKPPNVPSKSLQIAQTRRKFTNREIESKDLALLVRLEKKNENKLSPAYEEMPYKVTTLYGDQIYIKSRLIAGVGYIGEILSTWSNLFCGGKKQGMVHTFQTAVSNPLQKFHMTSKSHVKSCDHIVSHKITSFDINQLLYGFRVWIDGLIQTRGKVARVKKSARNDFAHFS